MDPQHYSPYHHPYYRVGTGLKDHHHHHHHHQHHHHQSVETAAQAAAVQSRILEMRKEKSRDAARSRRGKENHEFYELAKLLPLPAAITSQLGIMNKASIIRLTISYLKLRDFTLNGDPSWGNGTTSANLNNNALKNSKLCNIFEVHQGTHILQSLDGFAFALGQDGRFLYISETVSIYLGLSQVEMTGSSFFDYCHQQDHAELAEQLGMSLHQSNHSSGAGNGSGLSSSPLPPASVGSNASSESDSTTPFSNSTNFITANGSNDTLERQFCIRMKSTLTKRGCQHFKSSGYRVVHVVSHLRPEAPIRRDAQNVNPKIVGLVAVAIALPPPSVNELRLESDMFVMRLGLDFSIAHCEPRISELLDYTAEEITGRNLYSLVHGQDVIQMRKCHLDLMNKGQVMSRYYRLMNKNGGYTWLQTCATLICNNNNNSNSVSSKNSSGSGGTASGSGTTNSVTNSDEQEQSIITVNHVISATEYEDVIMDASQLPGGYLVNTNSSSSASSSVVSALSPVTPKGASPKSNHHNHIHSHHHHHTHHHHPHSSPSPSPPPTSNQYQQQSQQRRSSARSNTSSTNNNTNNSNSIQINGGSPMSPPLGTNGNEAIAKRRRFTSSPVRPWKSPSPPTTNSNPSSSSPAAATNGVNSNNNSSMVDNSSENSQQSTPASSLLRHISVIRETPPILKPQVVAPAYHHPHPHHHHPAAYHHLVDPYTAAYHLYKNGAGPTTGMTAAAAAAANAPSSASVPHHHHWGAYN